MLKQLSAYLDQQEWVRRLGHYWWIFPLLLASPLIQLPGWWWVPQMLVFTIILIFTQYAERVHDDQVCQQCINSWPSNPGDVAERRWRWLWWRHFGLVPAVALIVTFFVALFVFSLPTQTSTMMWVGIYASQAKARRLHDQLSLWCKWCRRDPGPDRETISPPPTPSETR